MHDGNMCSLSQANWMKYKRLWWPKFRSIDGEGVTLPDGSHNYILLASSDGSYIADENGLLTSECFRFLIRQAKTLRKMQHLVCYGASYDVNMMLKDVPERNLRELWQTTRTQFELDGYWWKVDYLYRKKLTVTCWRDRVKQGHFILYDVLGFFQSKFVKAVEDWLGKDYPTLKHIAQEKQRRSEFQASELNTILGYCREELTALDEIMERFSAALRDAGIHVRSWIGAGAVASTLLIDHKTKQKQCATVDEWPEVYQAARHAFFGGRIELLQYGYCEQPLYHYDINSAYPSVIATLPRLDIGQWHHVSGLPPQIYSFALVHIRWRVSHVFNPFPFRSKEGYVYFPPTGEGWVWYPELMNYPDAEVLESWYFDGCEPAFEWVKPLYDHRRELKQAGDPAHYPIKLGLNSLYGKQIQHVGGDVRKHQLPSFHQLEWAGYTTATVRSKLYAAARQRPDAIVSFQTDGIISTEPLTLDIGGSLGQWTEEPVSDNGVFVQSGVYFLRSGGEWSSFYRGFDEGSIRPDELCQSWERGDSYYRAKATRFITLGSALQGQAERLKNWRRWITSERQLDLYPVGKRVRVSQEFVCGRLNQTIATSIFKGSDGMSQPYNLPWDTWLESIDGVPSWLYEDEVSDE